ncbi:hypothetical protein DCC79_15650, partial [bacterium]
MTTQSPATAAAPEDAGAASDTSEDAMNDDRTPIPTHDPRPGADARLDGLVDRAVAALQADVPADADVVAAGARAWARIMSAAGAGAGPTADDPALIRDYLAGRLSPAQALLVADRIREDTAFRMALEAARRGVAPRVLTGVAA